jgi:hypothetical protein
VFLGLFARVSLMLLYDVSESTLILLVVNGPEEAMNMDSETSYNIIELTPANSLRNTILHSEPGESFR